MKGQALVSGQAALEMGDGTGTMQNMWLSQLRAPAEEDREGSQGARIYKCQTSPSSHSLGTGVISASLPSDFNPLPHLVNL